MSENQLSPLSLNSILTLHLFGFNSTCFFSKSRCFFFPTKNAHTMKAPFKGPWSLNDPIFIHPRILGRNLKLQGWMLGAFRSAGRFLPQGSPVVGGWKFKKYVYMLSTGEWVAFGRCCFCLFFLCEDVCWKWIILLLMSQGYIGGFKNHRWSTRYSSLWICVAGHWVFHQGWWDRDPPCLSFIEDSMLGKGTPSIQGGPLLVINGGRTIINCRVNG